MESDIPINQRANWGRTLAILVACLVFFLGVWLRGSLLAGPMRHDESLTYLFFVMPRECFNYAFPNNHVLNSLLMACASEVGGDSPAVLRAPVFLFGVLLMPATFWLCFELCGSILCSAAAMALVATSSVLVEYSVSARGYSIVTFCAAAMALLSLRLRTKPAWVAGWVLWSLCGAIGLFAIPTMVLPILTLAAVLVPGSPAQMRVRLPRLVLSLTGMVGLSGLLYSPVLVDRGLSSLVANRWVEPLKLNQVPAALGEVWGAFLEMTIRHGTMFLLFLVTAGIAAGIWEGTRNRKVRFLGLPAAALVAAILLAFVQRRVPPERVYTYLLPWMFACGLASLALVMKRLPGIGRSACIFCVALAAFCIAAVQGLGIVCAPYLVSEIKVPFTEAEQVVGQLAAQGVYTGKIGVAWRDGSALWPPVSYYLLRGLPQGEHITSWRDGRAPVVAILVSRDESVDEFLREWPQFSSLYGPPRLSGATPDCRIYLAHRLALP